MLQKHYVNENKNKKKKNPFFSIIISVYKEQINDLKNNLCSIQNQNFKNLEIIYLINHLKNESIKFLEQEKKREQRLKIWTFLDKEQYLVNINKKAKLIKGFYVLSLNFNDIMIHPNFLDFLFFEIKFKEYDLFEFSKIKGFNYSLTEEKYMNSTYYNYSYILKQPELIYSLFKLNHVLKKP